MTVINYPAYREPAPCPTQGFSPSPEVTDYKPAPEGLEKPGMLKALCDHPCTWASYHEPENTGGEDEFVGYYLTVQGENLVAIKLNPASVQVVAGEEIFGDDLPESLTAKVPFENFYWVDEKEARAVMRRVANPEYPAQFFIRNLDKVVVTPDGDYHRYNPQTQTWENNEPGGYLDGWVGSCGVSTENFGASVAIQRVITLEEVQATLVERPEVPQGGMRSLSELEGTNLTVTVRSVDGDHLYKWSDENGVLYHLPIGMIKRKHQSRDVDMVLLNLILTTEGHDFDHPEKWPLGLWMERKAEKQEEFDHMMYLRDTRHGPFEVIA